ncbi:MAG: hypothetical protein GY745_18400 [Actinomycetia bacterium]|nr:hypothetical protein [Actinomycetes bacterium]
MGGLGGGGSAEFGSWAHSMTVETDDREVVAWGRQEVFRSTGSGSNNSLAFFWFPNAPEAAPGVAMAGEMPGGGDIVSAHGSMNHVAFDVPADKFDEYVEKLKEKGLEPSPVLNHDNSETTVSRELHPGVFVRSVYFRDPDGVLLVFACWTSEFGPEDVAHAPANAQGERVQPVDG